MRKIREKKDVIEEGAGSVQSKDWNTNARVAAIAEAERDHSRPGKSTSRTGQKVAGKKASVADTADDVKPKRKVTGKKLKGTASDEYKKPPKQPVKKDATHQVHTHNPGRINRESNIRGLGVEKKEQNARNISSEQFYEQGASVYGEGHLYGTQQNTSQYPRYGRQEYEGTPEGFREYYNYDDRYWWGDQFPQSSSWQGESRYQHHDRPWSHRQNQQGHRRSVPYGGDYEKHNWMQTRYRPSEDYIAGRSRGGMTWGEAMYPDDQRLREDIYQDPGRNFDEDYSGYRQAYYGGVDIGRVPRHEKWRENRYMGGSHFHRDDQDWENWDAKQRDLEEFDAVERRRIDEERRRRAPRNVGGWGPRDEYRRRGEQYDEDRDYAEGHYHRREPDEYYSDSTDIRDRIMDYLDEDEVREERRRRHEHMRTVWTNTLDIPYTSGYNMKTPQSDRRVVGQGGYNQGGYGEYGYSEQYGNAGGYGSTGAYQSGHRGEHRRGDYDEGFIYDERQEDFASRVSIGDYDHDYIIGTDDELLDDDRPSYQARLAGGYGEDTAQMEGNVEGIMRSKEGNKWKRRNKNQRSR